MTDRQRRQTAEWLMIKEIRVTETKDLPYSQRRQTAEWLMIKEINGTDTKVLSDRQRRQTALLTVGGGRQLNGY